MAASLADDPLLIEERQPTLFQTPAWETAWRETWGQHLAEQPRIQVNQQSQSYHLTRRFKGWLPIRTATTLGCSERGVPSIRREYYRASPSLIKAQLQDITHQRIFSDVIYGSPTYHTLKTQARDQGFRVIEQDSSDAYSVDTTSGDYHHYLKQLSSNTRPKLHNRRSRLATTGTVTHTNVWPDVPEFLNDLNRFHQHRWGKPCYQGLNLAFIQRLLPLLGEEGHSVQLNSLEIDGKRVSVLLDIGVNQRVYNLQSGYEEHFNPGLSLGTLHFGYRIEQAFNDARIRAYDFMAGEGKRSNYKKALATQSCQLVTLVVIKPHWLQWLYRLKGSR